MYYCVLLLKKKIYVFIGKISLFKPLFVHFFGKKGFFIFVGCTKKRGGSFPRGWTELRRNYGTEIKRS